MTFNAMRQRSSTVQTSPAALFDQFPRWKPQHVRAVWTGPEHPAYNKESPKEIERIPLPDGIPTDRFQIFSVKDTAPPIGDTGEEGLDYILGVHGPSEVWAPHGLVEGHGAGGGIFAVIATNAAQYKVSPGDILYTCRQKGEVNTQVAFDSVLAIGAVDWSMVGRPTILNARVIATIEEQLRTAKVRRDKFKKRTGYTRRLGHRQPMTRFKINRVEYEMPDPSKLVPHDTTGRVDAKPERNITTPLI